MVPEGTPARFDAIFSGFPTPDITWIRNGIQTLYDSRDVKVSTVICSSVCFCFSFCRSKKLLAIVKGKGLNNKLRC
jgi:hypothetical protein